MRILGWFGRLRVRVALIFGVSAVLLYLLIPRNARFYYDYQKGKVWTYSTLIAPYDYPLYKPAGEYAKELDAVRKRAAPIFQIDTSVAANTETALVRELDAHLLARYDSLLLHGPGGHAMGPRSLPEAELQRLHELLSYIYGVGVVENPQVLQVANGVSFSVLRDGIAYPTALDEVFTPVAAAGRIVAELRNRLGNEVGSALGGIPAVAKWIQPNLRYDAELSGQIIQERLAAVSRVQGLVRKGERVAEKGEVVNEETFIRLESLREEMVNQRAEGGWSAVQEVCHAVLSVLVMGLFLLFMVRVYPRVLRHTRKLLFIMLLAGLMTTVAFLVIRFSPQFFYVVPVAIVPLLVLTFFDARLAFMTYLMVVSCISFHAPNSFAFVVMSFAVGLVAVYAQRHIYRRGQLFSLVICMLLCSELTYVVMKVIQEGELNRIDWMDAALLGGNALLVLATYQLIYPIERIFGFVSHTTLMELCDTNQPLLRELGEKAPGTLQHSLQVANLAEAAALKIGADALLVRTGALYHDIGKMEHPEFFTENQHPGMNPHAQLSEIESSRVIVAHVANGIQLAHKHRLPQQVVDFIRTHHGTTKTEYFYRTYRMKHPDEPDCPELFQYPGPRPFSREMALLMMADSIEAASRSLKVITEESLQELVDKIIANQQREEQYADTNLTFRDVKIVKELFVSKLQNIYHTRIEYPAEVDSEQEKKSTES